MAATSFSSGAQPVTYQFPVTTTAMAKQISLSSGPAPQPGLSFAALMAATSFSNGERTEIYQSPAIMTATARQTLLFSDQAVQPGLSFAAAMAAAWPSSWET